MYVGLIAGPIMATYYVILIKITSKKDYSNDAKLRYDLEYADKNIKTHENPKTNSTTSTNDNLVEHEIEKIKGE